MSEANWSEKQVEDLIEGFLLALIREKSKPTKTEMSEDASQ
jgi:hypothetical protein